MCEDSAHVGAIGVALEPFVRSRSGVQHQALDVARLPLVRISFQRGGLVFKEHRLCVSLNSRLESNKEEEEDSNTRTLDT